MYSSYGCKHSCMIEFLPEHVKNCPFQVRMGVALGFGVGLLRFDIFKKKYFCFPAKKRALGWG